jgi:predicted Rossmann-fold nucleotide-binding protein
MVKRLNKVIAAFGSSRISQGDARFSDVELLSQKLGQAGWHGLVGGHQGMMAAFSQGITAASGHVTGITLEVFPTPPHNSLSEEKRASDFFERMQILIEQPAAYLVLPGGLGTLAEFAMTWDLLAIKILEPRPLLVYGACWQPLIDMMQQQLVMSVDSSFQCIQYCETHEDVLAALAV